MYLEKVIIFGEGNIQEMAFFYLQREEKYEVCAFTADKIFIKSDMYMNRPMIPFENIEVVYPPIKYKMFIPMGYKRNNHLRAEKYEMAQKKGYGFITYISPKATYYGTPVGDNCFILENSIIQPFSKIGSNTILWSGSHIGHHSCIGNHCFLAPCATVCGGTEIGDYSFIGANATVRNEIKIAEDNIIGAGAVITNSTLEQEVYVPNRSILLNKKSNQISIDRVKLIR